MKNAINLQFAQTALYSLSHGNLTVHTRTANFQREGMDHLYAWFINEAKSHNSQISDTS